MAISDLVVKAGSADDVCQVVNDIGAQLLPRGGGSKTALSGTREDTCVLDLHELSGILEYEPGEYTFTARAGTPIAGVQAALAEHGQYLPFDPPLAGQGATLGGTIAAGLSGSGRQRFGGTRDFLIGVRFVDGQGRVVQGGGKVVKNAAGFDLPKLMVGSLGRLGVLVEVSFKVFPAPQAFSTVRFECSTLEKAITAMQKLAVAPLDLEALDLEMAADRDGNIVPVLWIRLGGLADVLAPRTTSLTEMVGGGTVTTGRDEPKIWQKVCEFAWAPDGMTLAKAPITPQRIVPLENRLAETGAHRRYTVGGHLAWIAWPGPTAELDTLLLDLGLSGLTILGSAGRPLIGVQTGNVFLQRIKRTLDPNGRYLNYGK